MAAPQQPPAVVLVGFMGAGKSAVGSELAARLGVPYADTDAVITATWGPIPEIFAARGEAGFRELEAELVVRELESLNGAPRVLALGGGAVLAPEVRTALQRCRHVVWLTAPAVELWRRVTSDADAERPLAKDRAAFTALLASREPVYREVSTMAADTAGRTPGEVADAVAARLRAEPLGAGEGRTARSGDAA